MGLAPSAAWRAVPLHPAAAPQDPSPTPTWDPLPEYRKMSQGCGEERGRETVREGLRRCLIEKAVGSLGSRVVANKLHLGARLRGRMRTPASKTRVLRRGFSNSLRRAEGFLEGVVSWVLKGEGCTQKPSERVLRRGLCRRWLKRPLGEHDPLQVHPMLFPGSDIRWSFPPP